MSAEKKAEARTSKASRAIDLFTASGAQLWHNPDGEPYADTRDDAGVRRMIPVRSRACRTLLSGLLYREEGSAIGGQSATDAIDVLHAIAIHEGHEREVYTRLARGPDGEIYLDLGDDSWSAVWVTAHGWDVVPEPPVRFRRPRGLRPLPVPTRDGSIEDLAPY